MRIRHLQLIKYGIFTDQLLEFPRGKFDFHLVYGLNEAGKSTIRNAIVDLLYGINRSSPYNFIHAYPEMCIGASIEADDRALDFQRWKRNKSSLVDPAGNALPDNVLAPFLGFTDQEYFQRIFALDHENMVKGGHEILDSSGDLGQMLFQAAAGLGSLQAVKHELEAEADNLWGPKAKESRAYYQALGRMEEAKSRLLEVRVTSNRWTTARRALDKVNDELTTTESRRNELKILCDRIQRIRRVSPLVAQLHDTLQRIEAFGPVIRMPANAAATLATAELEIAQAHAQAQIHQSNIQDAENKIPNFNPDAPILAHAVEVQRLAGIVASIQQFERDIPKRESEVAQETQALLVAARQVGWDSATPTLVAEQLPLQPLRSEIEELLARHPPLKGAVDIRTNDVTQTQSMLQRIQEDVLKLAPTAELPGLAAALKPAQSLNPNERQEELAKELAAANQKLDESLAALAPWTGNAETLTSTRAPDASEVQPLLEARARLRVDLGKFDQGIAERQLSLAGIGVELSQKRRERHLATAEELSVARQKRDAVFTRIVSGEVTAQSVASEYGNEVRTADVLADQRYDEAQETARLQALTNQSERLQAEVSQLEVQRERCVQQLAELQTKWEARTSELGLSGISLEGIQSWTQQRATALAAASALSLSKDRTNTFAARMQSVNADLRTELEKANIEVSPTMGLPTLVSLAEDVLSAALQNKTLHATLATQKSETTLKLQVAQAELTRAHDAIGIWEQEWSTKLKDASLPAGLSQAAMTTTVDLFRAMDRHLEKIGDLQNSRISPMRRETAQFGADVATLVSACAMDLDHKSASDAVVELAARLTKANADRVEHARLKAALASAKLKLVEADQRSSLAQAQLTPLLDHAAVPDLESLRNAISKSDSALALDLEAQRHRAAAIAAGGGMTLEDLEKEVSGVDLAQLGTQLEDAERQFAEMTTQRDTFLQLKAVAQADYSKIAGTDEAAKAEARRQAALAQMAAAADEYARVCAGARLLKWALDRYREEKQGPLLATASEYFSNFTNEKHVKLLVNTDDTPRLISRKKDNSTVGVEGMSDGTSDQLYLALRLAALELDLEGGTPLPFIADDLLINCDDERAASSFSAFNRLALKTQVIYFTHHQHLIDIARRISDNQVNIIEIH